MNYSDSHWQNKEHRLTNFAIGKGPKELPIEAETVKALKETDEGEKKTTELLNKNEKTKTEQATEAANEKVARLESQLGDYKTKMAGLRTDLEKAEIEKAEPAIIQRLKDQIKALEQQKEQVSEAKQEARNLVIEARKQRDRENPPKNKAEAAQRAMKDAEKDVQDPNLSYLEKAGAALAYFMNLLDYIKFSMDPEKGGSPEVDAEAQKKIAEAKEQDVASIKKEAKEQFETTYMTGASSNLSLNQISGPNGALDNKFNTNKNRLTALDGEIKTAHGNLYGLLESYNENDPTQLQPIKDAEKAFTDLVNEKSKLQREQKIIEEQKKIVEEAKNVKGATNENPYVLKMNDIPKDVKCAGKTFFMKLPADGYRLKSPTGAELVASATNNNVVPIPEGDNWQLHTNKIDAANKPVDDPVGSPINFTRGLGEKSE